MRLFLLVALAGLCAAQEPQWAASFADQGPEVLRGALGRRTQGIAVYSATICSGDEALSLSEAAILQQVNIHGMVMFSARSLEPLLVRVHARSFAALSADVGEAVTLGGAVVSSVGVIQMRERDRQKWAFSLALAAGVFHFLHGKLSGAVLDPQRVAGFILPNPVTLAAHQACWSGSLLGLPGGSGSFAVR